MFSGSRLTRLIFILAILLVAATCKPLYAEQRGDYLPVPAGAEEVNKEKRILAGSEMDVIYYVSSLKLNEITDFYRRLLPNAGWEELKLFAGQAKMPGFDDKTAQNFAKLNIAFKKDTDILMINFMPEQAYSDGKTRFTLSQSKLPSEAEIAAEESSFPELLAKPKKDVAPVYPQATLFSLSEGERSLNASYFTKDDIEEVIAFYKAKMSGYGWFLKEEEPLAKTDSSQLGAASCPTCPKNLPVSNKPIQMLSSTLYFSNAREDTCKIALAQTITQEEAVAFSKMTNILVNYEESKQ